MSSVAAPKRSLQELEALARPFVFVTGKGGVGKTTVSAALATALSRHGKRVLLATSDPKERMSQLLGVSRIDEQIAGIEPNLWAVNIDASAALREYGELILKAGMVHRALFDNRRVQAFLAAIPGLHQWAILGKAWYHSTELNQEGTTRFDHVIFDAPATGHALEMLWVPRIVTQVARTGFLFRDAERASTMLRDRLHTAVVLVAHAEEGPVSETLELVERLERELGLSPAWGVINEIVAPLLTEPERVQLVDLDPSRASASLHSQVGALQRRAASELRQRTGLERLRAGVPIPWWELPRTDGDAGNPLVVRQLSEALASGI